MGEAPGTGTQRAQHWDAAYEVRGVTEVSWFQPVATVSIELIERLETPTDASVIDIGGGASLLVDALLERGFSDLSVLDVSKSALDAVRERLGPTKPVALLHQDLLGWKPERRFDLWHDRAVFHFLVDRSDRATYLQTLRSALRPGGAVVMATFASDGPEYCSGLPVARYSSVDLAEILGPDFAVVEQLREEHVTPAGATQPFTWVAARNVVDGR
jgi:SAM-dependent methyltransferase